MSSGHQTLGLDSIVVEPTPFLKVLTRERIVLLGIPLQHSRGIRQTNATTELLDRRRRRVKHIVSIDYADLVDSLQVLLGASCRRQVWPGAHTRAYETFAAEVVEVPTQLVIPSLLRIEVLEPRHAVERRDRAAVVRGDTIMRVPDEESPVELRLDLLRHDRWVSRLCRRAERIGWAGRHPIGVVADFIHSGTVVAGAVDSAVSHHAVGAICSGAVGLGGVAVGVGTVAGTVHAVGRGFFGSLSAYAALQTSKRWSNARWLPFLREQV